MVIYTNLFLSIDHDNCCHSDQNAKIQTDFTMQKFTQCLFIFKKLKEFTVYLYRKLLSKIQLLAVKIKQINHDFNNYTLSSIYVFLFTRNSIYEVFGVVHIPLLCLRIYKSFVYMILGKNS